MDFANQFMFGLGELFDAFRHFMQFLQHRMLMRRNPMHPPKANQPAAKAYPGERENEHCLMCARSDDDDVNGDVLADPGHRFRSPSKHETEVAASQRLGRNLPVRLFRIARGRIH